jgi:hypothetical protein
MTVCVNLIAVLVRRPGFVRLYLEENTLINSILGICTRVNPVQHTGISPRSCAPHVRDMGHCEADHGLEMLWEIVVECTPCPNRPVFEERPKVVNTFFVQRIELFILWNTRRFRGNISNGYMNHRRQRLRGRLEVEKCSFAIDQGSLDSWILTITIPWT